MEIIFEGEGVKSAVPLEKRVVFWLLATEPMEKAPDVRVSIPHALLERTHLRITL